MVAAAIAGTLAVGAVAVRSARCKALFIMLSLAGAGATKMSAADAMGIDTVIHSSTYARRTEYSNHASPSHKQSCRRFGES